MAKNQCFAIFREANSFEYKRAMYTKPDRGLNISVAWNQEQGGFSVCVVSQSSSIMCIDT